MCVIVNWQTAYATEERRTVGHTQDEDNARTMSGADAQSRETMVALASQVLKSYGRTNFHDWWDDNNNLTPFWDTFLRDIMCRLTIFETTWTLDDLAGLQYTWKMEWLVL